MSFPAVFKQLWPQRLKASVITCCVLGMLAAAGFSHLSHLRMREAFTELKTAADALSKARTKVARKLTGETQKHLVNLGISAGENRIPLDIAQAVLSGLIGLYFGARS